MGTLNNRCRIIKGDPNIDNHPHVSPDWLREAVVAVAAGVSRRAVRKTRKRRRRARRRTHGLCKDFIRGFIRILLASSCSSPVGVFRRVQGLGLFWGLRPGEERVPTHSAQLLGFGLLRGRITSRSLIRVVQGRVVTHRSLIAHMLIVEYAPNPNHIIM